MERRAEKRSWRRALRRRATRGSVAVVFAAAVLPLLAGAGLAIDSAVVYAVRIRMIEAADSAALAAARVARSDDVATDARAFFDANFPPGYMRSTLTAFAAVPDDEARFVTIRAEASVPMVLMRLFGRETANVRIETVAERLNRGLELALVMDNTGSMRSSDKIGAMRRAARTLVGILFGDNETAPKLWISLVPYTATVNVGPGRTGWLEPGDPARASPSGFAPVAWKGCVMARATPADETDQPPTLLRFRSFLWEPSIDNDWDPADPDSIDEANARQNDGTGPNLGCGPAITSLTNRRQTVLDAIDEMLPWHRGGTTSNLGMVWGWRTISPDWRGLWGGPTPEEMPFDYDEPLMDKAVVLLTDGENQFFDWPGDPNGANGGPRGSDLTAYGREDDFLASFGGGNLDERLKRMCATMRAAGVTIYTITFQTSAGIKNIYRECAGEPANFFDAPGDAELQAAFEQIGQRLSNVRLVR